MMWGVRPLDAWGAAASSLVLVAFQRCGLFGVVLALRSLSVFLGDDADVHNGTGGWRMQYRSAEARNASACLQIALLPSSLPSVAFRGVGNDILVEEGTFSSSR